MIVLSPRHSTIATAYSSSLFARVVGGRGGQLPDEKDLGFTDADRIEYVRRVAEVARPMVG